MENLFFFFLSTRSKAEAALLFGVSSSVSVPLVIVRTVSQRRVSAQQEKHSSCPMYSEFAEFVNCQRSWPACDVSEQTHGGPVEVWEISEKEYGKCHSILTPECTSQIQ